MICQLRSRRGNAVSELPGVLWLIFIVLLFPLVDFCTMGIRAALVFSACNQASLAASKARSYQVGDSTYPSAQDYALSVAQTDCSSWSGVSLNSVSTQILITDINTQVQTRQPGKLTNPPDTASNTYQVEVTINASIDPLVTVNLPFLANIPGISAPYQLSVTQRNYVENSQGLMR